MTQVEGCALTMISSTARDPNAYGIRFINAIDPTTQRPMFRLIRAGMTNAVGDAPLVADVVDANGDMVDPTTLYYSDLVSAELLKGYFRNPAYGQGSIRTMLGGTPLIPWHRVDRIDATTARLHHAQLEAYVNRRMANFLAGVPAHQDVDAVFRLQYLMDEDAWKAEILNQKIRQPYRPAFPQHLVLNTWNSPDGPYVEPANVEHDEIRVVYDPAAAGLQSQAAIISCVYPPGARIVRTETGGATIQLDNSVARDGVQLTQPTQVYEQTEYCVILHADFYDGQVTGSVELMTQYILAHIQYVRTHFRACRNARVRLVVENNLAQMGRNVFDMMKRVLVESRPLLRENRIMRGGSGGDGIMATDLHIELYSDPIETHVDSVRYDRQHMRETLGVTPVSHRIGFYTSNARKVEMVRMWTNAMRLGLVRFHRDFSTTSIDRYTAADVREMLMRQFLGFRAEEVVIGGGGSGNSGKRSYSSMREPEVRVRYSGKGGPGKFDDGVMCLLINYFSKYVDKIGEAYL